MFRPRRGRGRAMKLGCALRRTLILIRVNASTQIRRTLGDPGRRDLPMRVVEAQKVEKTYQAGNAAAHAVRSMDFVIDAGAFVAFVGPSGSGKSTLLNMI